MKSKLALIAAFLIVRIGMLIVYDPVVTRGDEAQYMRVAQSLGERGIGGYLNPGFVIQKGSYFPYFFGRLRDSDGAYNPIFWEPLYPLFLAVVFAVAGESTVAVRIVHIVLAFLTLCLGMSTVKRAFPSKPRAARVFGWAFALYLPLAGFVTKIFGETLDGFLLALLLWLLCRLVDGRVRKYLAFGLVMGLYISLKAYWLTMLGLVCLLLGWFFRSFLRAESETDVPRWAIVPRIALVAVTASLVLAPTFYRNYGITEGALTICTKNSWNFWKDNNNFSLENHDWGERGSEQHLWLTKRWDGHPNAEVRPFCDEPFSRVIACEKKGAMAFFLGDPIRFFKRAFYKNVNLWTPNSYIFNRAEPGTRAWNQNFRFDIPKWIRYGLQLIVLVSFLSAMVFGMIGLLVRAESAEHRLLRGSLVLFLVYLSAVVAWGHGSSRLRLPTMVPILMFAALGVCEARQVLAWIRFRRGTRIKAVLLSLFLGFLLFVCAEKLPLLLRFEVPKSEYHRYYFGPTFADGH